MKILESTRKAADQSVRTQLFLCLGSLILGILLGVFQKYLDISQAELPPILGTIDRLFDLHNFFGKFLPWIVAAVCLSVYSASPIRAGVNVFSFFTGMVSSYYLYSYYVGGFFQEAMHCFGLYLPSYPRCWLFYAGMPEEKDGLHF